MNFVCIVNFFLVTKFIVHMQSLWLLASFSRGVLCHEIANDLEHIDHHLAVDTILDRVKGAIHVRSGTVVEWLSYLQECRDLLVNAVGGLPHHNYLPVPCMCLRCFHCLVGCWKILTWLDLKTLLTPNSMSGERCSIKKLIIWVGLWGLGFLWYLRYIKFTKDLEFNNIRSAELDIENPWRAVKPHQSTPKTKSSLWNKKWT